MSTVVKTDDVIHECQNKKIRLEKIKNESTAAVAGKMSRDKASCKTKASRMIRKTDDGFQECRKKNIRLEKIEKIPAKIHQGRRVINPIKCRHCGKIFHDASNRRKHENNRVCSAGKAKHDLIKCIGLHFENVYALLVDVYADIAKHMENVLGKAIFEENKIYLLDESLRLMKRSWISEHFNILASLEVIEKGKSTQMNEANTNNL